MAPKNRGKALASSSAPPRASKATTTSPSHSLAPPRDNHAQSQLPHVVNKHDIVFVDDVQRERYDALMSRIISEPKYVDTSLLRLLHLWDDLNALFGVLGR